MSELDAIKETYRLCMDAVIKGCPWCGGKGRPCGVCGEFYLAILLIKDDRLKDERLEEVEEQ